MVLRKKRTETTDSRLLPIFTPREREQNEARKNELANLIASTEAVLVVGAGSSASVGYGTWPTLVSELELLANECGKGFEVDTSVRENDPLRFVESAKSHIRSATGSLDRYHAHLHRLFKSRTPQYNEFHKALVGLPVRGILTTNYDPVLEAALASIRSDYAHDNWLVVDEGAAARVSEFLMAMNNVEWIPRRIAHLHGRFDRPQGIVLSLQDYVEAYGLTLPQVVSEPDHESRWKLHRKVLWAILATRRVIFVGFSMRDPYLNELLEAVSVDLWRWDEPVHFAIMDISPPNAEPAKHRAELLRQQYGIDVVFYENLDGRHQGLSRMIDEFVQRVKSEPSASPIIRRDELDRDAGEVASARLEAEKGGGGTSSEWLEAQNQKMEKRTNLHED